MAEIVHGMAPRRACTIWLNECWFWWKLKSIHQKVSKHSFCASILKDTKFLVCCNRMLLTVKSTFSFYTSPIFFSHPIANHFRFTVTKCLANILRRYSDNRPQNVYPKMAQHTPGKLLNNIWSPFNRHQSLLWILRDTSAMKLESIRMSFIQENMIIRLWML